MMSETTKYKLLSIVRYLGDSLYYPFLALYLTSRGLLEAKIGFILSLTPIIAIIVNPIYASICKNVSITKNVLKIITIIEAILITVLAFCSNFVTISILVVLIAIVGTSHYGLMDSLTALYSNQQKIPYTSIRIFGSMAYIIGTTLGGYLIKILNFQVCFIIASLLFIISGIIYQLINPLKTEKINDNNTKNEGFFICFKNVIKNKKYVLFIVFYILFMGTTNAADYFFPIYLETRGITTSGYGMIFSYLVLIEVITMFVINRLKKKPTINTMLLTASIVLFIRLITNGLYAPLFLVIIFAGFRGLAWGMILYISYQYVIDTVGEKYATFGVMLMTLGQFIYVAIANNINGIIIEALNQYQTFYFIMASLAFICFIVVIIKIIIDKKKPIVQ